MVKLTYLLLLGSSLYSSQIEVTANPVPTASKGPWTFMWGPMPPPEYQTTKTISCVAGGATWIPGNENARPITSLMIHSTPEAVTGITVTFAGSDIVTHGLNTGTTTIITLTEDDFLDKAYIGCSATGVKSLFLETRKGRTISANTNTAAGQEIHYVGAIYKVLGAASATQLTAFGTVSSEVDGE